MDKKTYRIDELAKGWGVSRETVRREIKRGELDAFRVGHTVRVPSGAVEEYERKKKLNSSTQA